MIDKIKIKFDTKKFIGDLKDSVNILINNRKTINITDIERNYRNAPNEFEKEYILQIKKIIKNLDKTDKMNLIAFYEKLYAVYNEKFNENSFEGVKDYEDYVEILQELSYLYKNLNYYDKAISLMIENIEIRQEYLKKDYVDSSLELRNKSELLKMYLSIPNNKPVALNYINEIYFNIEKYLELYKNDKNEYKNILTSYIYIMKTSLSIYKDLEKTNDIFEKIRNNYLSFLELKISNPNYLKEYLNICIILSNINKSTNITEKEIIYIENKIPLLEKTIKEINNSSINESFLLLKKYLIEYRNKIIINFNEEEFNSCEIDNDIFEELNKEKDYLDILKNTQTVDKDNIYYEDDIQYKSNNKINTIIKNEEDKEEIDLNSTEIEESIHNKILVFDENTVTLNILGKILDVEHFGIIQKSYDYQDVYNNLTNIRMKIDILIVSNRIKNITIENFISHIRNDLNKKDLIIIISAGEYREGIEETFNNLDIEGVFFKPLDKMEIKNLIKKVIAKRQINIDNSFILNNNINNKNNIILEEKIKIINETQEVKETEETQLNNINELIKEIEETQLNNIEELIEQIEEIEEIEEKFINQDEEKTITTNEIIEEYDFIEEEIVINKIKDNQNIISTENETIINNEIVEEYDFIEEEIVINKIEDNQNIISTKNETIITNEIIEEYDFIEEEIVINKIEDNENIISTENEIIINNEIVEEYDFIEEEEEEEQKNTISLINIEFSEEELLKLTQENERKEIELLREKEEEERKEIELLKEKEELLKLTNEEEKKEIELLKEKLLLKEETTKEVKIFNVENTEVDDFYSDLMDGIEVK